MSSVSNDSGTPPLSKRFLAALQRINIEIEFNNYLHSSFLFLAPFSNQNCPITTWLPNAKTIAGSPIGLTNNTFSLLRSPRDTFIDESNILYVLDSWNYRVQRFFPNSTIGTTMVNGSYGTRL